MTDIYLDFEDLNFDSDENEDSAASCVKTVKRTKYDNQQDVTRKSFEMLDEVSPDHSFLHTHLNIVDRCLFNCAILSERKMMQKDLPEGIYVKFYENRLDLCTAMIEGPEGTPYTGCLFFFDVQLSKDYPNSAPKVKYISYTTEKLNPNLYVDGKVCLSLLGTWPGSPEEMWSKKSTLLQLFVSIQGLILVSEPYYNEPAYRNQKGMCFAASKMYNQDVVKLVIETMLKQMKKPPNCFRDEVLDHYRSRGLEIHNQLEASIKRNPSSALFLHPEPEYHIWYEFDKKMKAFKNAVDNLGAVTPPIEKFENTKLDENKKDVIRNSFEMLDEVGPDHSFLKIHLNIVDRCLFNCAILSEKTMMQKDLPEGIYVKFYENRFDLFTAMIEGPKGTPYAECLFFFDVQLSKDYPISPPKVKYISYSRDKLNPNLYVDGKVGLSLLGTLPGSPEEMWSPKTSSLLQLFVSIQELILVPEPYYNEPAYRNQKGMCLAASEMYNKNVVNLVIETMLKQMKKPPNCFRDEVLDHYRSRGLEIYNQLEACIKNPSSAPFPLPKYGNSLQAFKDAVVNLGSVTPPIEAKN